MSIPKRVEARLKAGLKKFRPIIDEARKADRSEQDTVTIVTDILADVLGYDKYHDITGEYQIRGTYCDLAVKVDDKLRFLIEVKAADRTLKDSHLRQATDYAAKEGIEWVILTNAVEWHVHRMIFEQPVRHERVFALNLLADDSDVMETLYLLSIEGAKKRVIRKYHEQIRALNRFSLAAAVISEPVLKVICREIKRASPGIRVDVEDVEELIVREVVKRDVMDSAEVQDAVKRLRKARDKKLKKRNRSKRPTTPPANDTPQVD
jgi:predicted type IV restriction endonuclease